MPADERCEWAEIRMEDVERTEQKTDEDRSVAHEGRAEDLAEDDDGEDEEAQADEWRRAPLVHLAAVDAVDGVVGRARSRAADPVLSRTNNMRRRALTSDGRTHLEPRTDERHTDQSQHAACRREESARWYVVSSSRRTDDDGREDLLDEVRLVRDEKGDEEREEAGHRRRAEEGAKGCEPMRVSEGRVQEAKVQTNLRDRAAWYRRRRSGRSRWCMMCRGS